MIGDARQHIGILMLAAMGLLGLHDLNRANGIKNFLGICINCIAVFSFLSCAARNSKGRVLPDTKN